MKKTKTYDQRFYFENDENHFCRTIAITDTCKIDNSESLFRTCNMLKFICKIHDYNYVFGIIIKETDLYHQKFIFDIATLTPSLWEIAGHFRVF